MLLSPIEQLDGADETQKVQLRRSAIKQAANGFTRVPVRTISSVSHVPISLLAVLCPMSNGDYPIRRAAPCLPPRRSPLLFQLPSPG